MDHIFPHMSSYGVSRFRFHTYKRSVKEWQAYQLLTEVPQVVWKPLLYCFRYVQVNTFVINKSFWELQVTFGRRCSTRNREPHFFLSLWICWILFHQKLHSVFLFDRVRILLFHPKHIQETNFVRKQFNGTAPCNVKQIIKFFTKDSLLFISTVVTALSLCLRTFPHSLCNFSNFSIALFSVITGSLVSFHGWNTFLWFFSH